MFVLNPQPVESEVGVRLSQPSVLKVDGNQLYGDLLDNNSIVSRIRQNSLRVTGKLLNSTDGGPELLLERIPEKLFLQGYLLVDL